MIIIQNGKKYWDLETYSKSLKKKILSNYTNGKYWSLHIDLLSLLQTCNIENQLQKQIHPKYNIFFLGLQGQAVLDQLLEKFAGSAQ